MNLTALTGKLENRLANALPAQLAHELLRAKPIGKILPTFEHKTPPKQGSVIILLYEEDASIKFPLIKRSTYTGAHSAQISLPGGKVEPGESAYDAALREAEEEIGVSRNDMRIVGKLSELNVIPSNFLVTPVIATIDYVPAFVPDPYEVEKIIHGELDDLLREDSILEKEILAAGRYTMMAPHFLIEDEIVWGATAMMLNEFRMVVMDIIEH